MVDNILFIDSSQGTGGATKSLLSLLKHLDSRRFKPFVINHKDGTFASAFRHEGICILSEKLKLMQILMLDPYFGLKYKNHLIRKGIKLVGMGVKLLGLVWVLLRDYVIIIKAINRNHINLVHFNMYSDFYLPIALICHLCRVPVVFHVRGKVRPSPYMSFFTRYVSAFIHVSKFVEDYFLSSCASRPVHFCIYNGRDPEEYVPCSGIEKSELKESLKISSDNKIIICIGTLSRGKGQDTFIKAAGGNT